MTVVTPRRRLRIAVLCCFPIPENIAKERGQFDDIFASWILASVNAHNAKKPNRNDQVVAEVTGFDVIHKDQYPTQVNDFDALIVTGSVASAYDDEPWIHKLAAFLRDVYENSPTVKIFGGCFGHQLIGQAFLAGHGARVVKNPKGWEIGVHQVSLTENFASHFPCLKGRRDISYQFLHQDVVQLDGPLPQDWVQMGTSPLCDVHGFLVPGRLLTYQGHPEFDSFINELSTLAVQKAGTGLVSDEKKTEEYLSLVRQDDTRLLAGEMAIQFFLS
ncbi:gmp synthase [Colletotrichum karsti]|uniref:Gmp synthase n=1 Tax=Colletotrichum karsti TaxID=1095194 RepID=A0A9P6LDA7_9PEZI|nr:gmp synthase [Colletotrichum karsti]KAF9871274.1 gmp synthase [Colletotrichum karsti]